MGLDGVLESEPGYRPMMSAKRAQRLHEWHEKALAEGRRADTITVTQLDRTFVVPPEVYAPHPLGLAELVLEEVVEGDRVLDLGTGSGVNGIVAASTSKEVVAVDVNPIAVQCARRNTELNNVASRVDVQESDLFANVSGRFDVIIFDPPFRWFRPRNLYERGTSDENYETLTAFFREVHGYLRGDGRILLSFGTTGDIDYLRHLIDEAGFHAEELRKVEGEKDGFPVTYYAYRLREPPG